MEFWRVDVKPDFDALYYEQETERKEEIKEEPTERIECWRVDLKPDFDALYYEQETEHIKKEEIKSEPTEPRMDFLRVDVKPNFEELLYEDEVEDDVKEESGESEFGDSGDEIDEPVAPPYSPLTSPERCDSRDRSRSPITHHQPSVSLSPWGIVIYDEEGTPLDPPDAPLSGNGGDGVFFSPDEHITFELDERINSSVSDGGRARGRNRRVRERKNQRPKWAVGFPVNEIWRTDSDLPPELLANIVKRKQKKYPNNGEANESEDDAVHDSLEEGQNMRFEWSPMDTFRGEEEIFKPKRTGSTQCYESAYDAFRSYWDNKILKLIVEETNQYATKIKSPNFQSEWFPTNVHEILCLFAFWMMLGIIRMPSIPSCFSTDPLLNTQVFRSIFLRNRYENLIRALHFDDSGPASNDTNPERTSAARSLDRLHRLRPILNHLNSKFKSNYILDKDICIDESLTLWKGRLDIKQYIRTKASRFGIKTFELCESKTGYLWSFIVYTGKKATTDFDLSPSERKSTVVVKKLMEPLLNKGYRLFMDNWYNSPALARFLKLNGTDCVGTLRSCCHDVPALIYRAPLQQGQMIARHSGDVMVLSWQDRSRVTMISTCHGSATALPTVASASKPTSRPVPHKPQVVLDYNKFMGGVDLKDQMLEPYLLERKRCSKWYMKLFKRLLNVSILNARTLFQSSTQKKQDHLAFRLQLVDSILTNHLQQCPVTRRYAVSASRSSHQSHIRNSRQLTHFPVRLQQTESSLANERSFRKRCIVCLREGRKSSKTAFSCETCNVPLCIENCFKAYHMNDYGPRKKVCKDDP
ncbi:hypothetical protein ABMA27_011608 [Loxostege sticticalis]|uniref:Transposase n=1 Tax=Loxostege sticticalis TaxID=481309 RepID=A0ABR3IGW6_LOXSC